MKLRKSFMSLFLVIALLAALFAVPVSADDNRKVTNTIDLGDGIIATTYRITGTAGRTAGSTGDPVCCGNNTACFRKQCRLAFFAFDSLQQSE